MEIIHTPVLKNEVLQYLKLKANQHFIDCTVGGGGHLRSILERISPNGKILAIDLDPTALRLLKNKIKIETKNKNRVVFAHGNFKNLKKIADECGFSKADGILIDLGYSSNQIDDSGKGLGIFSDMLDMRYDRSSGGVTAEQVVNNFNEASLAGIFKEYGEERLAKPIARAIVSARKEKAITAPRQLAEIISGVYRHHYSRPSKINPATKVFQALRIEVNAELDSLSAVLPQAVEILNSGGRMAVISFHSLEDRIVKDFYRKESRDCVCPYNVPICQCGHKKSLLAVTKKPIVPTEQEAGFNPRSRSAKLRVAEKI